MKDVDIEKKNPELLSFGPRHLFDMYQVCLVLCFGFF